jgi:hypothetical protein
MLLTTTGIFDIKTFCAIKSPNAVVYFNVTVIVYKVGALLTL